MPPRQNRQVILKSRPLGIPQAEHFQVVSTPLPELKPGELLVRNDFLSVDPAMRGWVNAAANYSDPVAVGAVMRSFAAGHVIASRHPAYAENDRVMGMLGWQEYAVTDGRSIRRKVGEPDLPLSLSLGVLGLNGVTAYFALTEVGEPRPGDTVVVSTAAGAVGSAVGQIAKIAGCRTVGIAGGPQKVAWCRDEFGYDAAIDYKSASFETRPGRRLPPRRQCVFRQYLGSHFRRRTAPAREGRARRDLWNRIGAELGAVAGGTARRTAFAEQVRAHAGISDLGLRASLQRGRHASRPHGFAAAGCVIAKKSSTAWRRPRTPSRVFTGARIWASA